MSKKVTGMSVKCEADDGTAEVIYKSNGEVIDTQIFQIQDILDSAIAKQYLVKSIMPMLSARNSGLKGLDKLDAMRATWELWTVRQEWAEDRQGGIRTVSVEVEAIARFTGQSIANAAKSWKAASDEVKAAILLKPEVAEQVEKVKAERATQDDSLDLTSLITTE